MDFKGFITEIKAHGWLVYAAALYEKGTLMDSYGDITVPHEIYSATKTVLSLAVGAAWDRGLFDLEAPIMKYLPSAYTEKLSEEEKEKWSCLTVERLLTMSVVGFPFRPAGEDYLKFALECELKNPEIRHFKYTNISAYLVGVALSEALKGVAGSSRLPASGKKSPILDDSGMTGGSKLCTELDQPWIGADLPDFIAENILNPLGIHEFEYGRSPEGYFYGASQMKLSTRDLAKVGLLLAGRGVFEGKRILSEEYVRRATSCQISNKNGGYGYFIWCGEKGFSINGKWGQRCFVIPDQDLVIAYESHMEEGAELVEECMIRHLTK